MEQKDINTCLKDIKEIVKEFCESRDWDQFHSPKDLAIAIITEASELLEIFRFKSIDETEEMLENKQKRQQIADEISDIFYFVVRFSQKYGFDLTSEFLRKMQQNTKKYPIEKSKGSNKKYSEV